MNIAGSLLALIVYFTIYALVHSWLVGAPAKDWTSKHFGPAADRWYRLGYNIIAVITLLPVLVMIVLLPDQVLYIVPSPWRWLLVGGQLLALIAAGLALWQTDPLYFAGLAQLVARNPAETGALQINGFYARMRHPLYTFSLVFLWLMPVMTTNLLTTFILFTLYFYIGSTYEERRLIARFGPSYEAYRRQVPRFIPLPGRRYMPQISENVR